MEDRQHSNSGGPSYGGPTVWLTLSSRHPLTVPIPVGVRVGVRVRTDIYFKISQRVLNLGPSY